MTGSGDGLRRWDVTTAATNTRGRLVAGWTAVGFVTLVATAWAVWGGIENFHEGWYYPSLWANLGLLLLQYLSPMIVTVVVGLLAIRRPRVGAVVCLVLGAVLGGWAVVLVGRSGEGWGPLLSWLPMVAALAVVAALFWFGRVRPACLANAIIVLVPLAAAAVAGLPGAVRVAQRVDDGDLGQRVVTGNGVTLRWAPQGPGWPQEGPGATWAAAEAACRTLSVDGTEPTSTPSGVWRLPTVDEAVRSLMLHGDNAGGKWDEATATASYTVSPDKETPLWNPHSPVIYWWTASETDAAHAYRIAYNGVVMPLPKESSPTYLQYRCVAPP